jgi:16S rRNA (guanine1516-N2)-methyltransferase
VRWLRALTPVTYRCKLLGIPALAAFLRPELFRVTISGKLLLET